MIAGIVTFTAFLLLIVIVVQHVNTSLRLLATGSLPVIWISVCGLSGLLDVLFGIDARISLGIVLFAIGVATLVGCRGSLSNWSWSLPKIDGISALAIAIVTAMGAWVAYRAQLLEPWGSWDAMFTWVMRGRFFDNGGEQWANAFSNDMALLHPDYPPLLGFALHALWKLDGVETSAAIAWLCLPVWPALLLLILGWQRVNHPEKKLLLTIPIAMLLATPILWKLAASKLADFVLAYAILGSAAWWSAGKSQGSRWCLMVAGFFAAWSAHIKNEGLLWFLAFSVSVFLFEVFNRRESTKRNLLSVASGLAVPLFFVVLFKLTLAPPSDLMSPQRTFEIGEIVQPGTMINPAPLLVRIDQAFDLLWHRLIWEHVAGVLMNFQDWGLTLWAGLVLLVWRLRRPRRLPPLLLAVVIQFLGYYTVYLITPYHPYWHLSTSLSRILTHIVPVALCLLIFDRPRNEVSTPAPNRADRLRIVFAALYCIALSGWNVSSLERGIWSFGQQPVPDFAELEQIEFPSVDRASYVSNELGIRDLYITQFEAVPTVLLVDRRETILLARFSNEDELQHYCQRYHWQLQKSSGGFGWARDLGGESLVQPVEVTPLR